MNKLLNDIMRFDNSMINPNWTDQLGTSDWALPTWETTTTFGNSPLPMWVKEKGSRVLKIEMPGVDKKDIKVTLEENNVLVEAKTKSAFGEFSHSSINSLPSACDVDKIKVKYSNGILKLTVPVAEKSKTEIPID